MTTGYASAEMFAAFLETQPAHVRRIAEAYPPTNCYRMKGSHGHFLPYAYAPDGTVTIGHGKDSTLPGVAAFGIDPATLTPCGCGKWEPPTPEQTRETKRQLNQKHRASCRDPRCACHRGSA